MICHCNNGKEKRKWLYFCCSQNNILNSDLITFLLDGSHLSTGQRSGSLVQHHVALTLRSSVIFHQLPTIPYNLVIPVCLMSGQLQAISLWSQNTAIRFLYCKWISINLWKSYSYLLCILSINSIIMYVIIIIMYLICVSELTEQPGVVNSYFCSPTTKKVIALRRYSVYGYWTKTNFLLNFRLSGELNEGSLRTLLHNTNSVLWKQSKIATSKYMHLYMCM